MARAFAREATLDPPISHRPPRRGFRRRRARLVVEVDGGQHGARQEADEARTLALNTAGWRVIRFWNNEVLGNLEGVVETILAAAGERLPGGEEPVFTGSRAGRERHPRKEPTPAPPAKAGGGTP